MANNVRVLLQADVDNLGTGGEIVKVRAGFARNFLLPRGLALPATAGNLARVEELKKHAAVRAAEEQGKAEASKAQLETVSVKIERAAAGEENKMYGSVTTKDLEDAFTAAGVKIDRKKLLLKEPIRQFGPFEVQLKLYGTVTATLKGEVVKKGKAG
jgi:large subunit ribosomal protein L9